VSAAKGAGLLPLFLVSAAAVGFEVALTRYFAVAKWSEYGYWVISIVMAGFALSGVVLALARAWAVRHASALLRWLPVAMLLAAAAGYHAATVNPFNPLLLQNAATWQPQLGLIFLYYACLLPFFFLAGLYVSLCFVVGAARVGLVYAADLTGAGAGAALMLALMYVVHPFHLAAVLLLLLAAAALAGPPPRRGVLALAVLLACAGGEALVLLDDAAAYNEFKAIYAPLHVPGSRVLAVRNSPRGIYELLDDFTERVDTDISNDAGMLGLPGPPATFGLYRDGARLAALPKPSGANVGYARAALPALPYLLRPGADVLLAGASGGFRIREALALGAAHVTALEPDPVLRAALRHGLGDAPALPADPRVTVRAIGPLAAAREGTYDLIDLSGDFLDEAEANATAFTAEALAADLRALRPGGLVSVPVSIREFPVYAVRMLATARAALLLAGIDDAPAHVVAYRSAWNLRILLSPVPWRAGDIAAVRKFCDDRSFDVSYYPGMDAAASRAGIYNDLPAVSFADGDVTSAGGPADSIADEALAALQGRGSESQTAFNLAPVTLDRPFFYNVLRLGHLGTILRRVEILPQPEVGALVNLAVLAQALVLAAGVLLVPLASFGRVRARGAGLLRAVCYFPALGLGFLFIEIFLIEKASLYLNDRTTGFALVLTGMLVFSGLGSLLADRAPAGAMRLAGGVIVGWCALLLVGLQPALLATLGWPPVVRALLVLVVLAPASVALGLPFALGLRRIAASGGGVLPWAWALNGAFSVVATPLANLIAQQAGFERVLFCAAISYILATVSFPSAQKRPSWQDIAAPSRDVV
jgi:spermidine synthase